MESLCPLDYQRAVIWGWDSRLEDWIKKGTIDSGRIFDAMNKSSVWGA